MDLEGMVGPWIILPFSNHHCVSSRDAPENVGLKGLKDKLAPLNLLDFRRKIQAQRIMPGLFILQFLQKNMLITDS
ncbi:MAG: hypothetical protein A3C58_01845 [Candidatus Staskawiczbacteria bacterium RIFCSPHIGHO2_02_FULL_34_10]|uniref:Uncharacterized protein n=2 Tax=Candidatus Staskawicziibacteriota TaxID=1817916 RepID=A0A1G2HL30_9BACT|nr:MAG: hypothetical protein A2639_03135 [Candidatus Staskawiczbacteria bacterium RIFCSPHIGHO2_01_FULL_34_27]OGZ67717.1 MAG: hypothetical protein A3C58_01845 [Candidatus Staskawiczbacteria bacterium RIFCSPHIGHO2_02_FULL_34_10]